MSNRSKTRIYYAAAVCLLVVAAALRFWDLPGNSLWYDEAVAANNSRGSLEEVLENTRIRNTSPILYPVVLYAVQNVESSSLSVRIVPAAASVLTVAALLFLLPRVGVSRWAAFTAALLAVGSVEIIQQARDAREYSIDTFVAVLMTAGMLSYIRGKYGGGTYVLFCVSLFIAPLVQYGLVLFGIAVFGTIAVMEGRAFWGRRATLREGLRFPRGWVWRRLSYFVWPAVSFAAGCAISLQLTLVHQWAPDGFAGGPGEYLEAYHYSGDTADVPAMIGFVLSRTGEVLRYHMTGVLVMLGLAGFAVFLILSMRKVRLDAVATLLLLSLAVAACAALMRAYPYGETRQCVYLAPIIFLAFGHALHSIASAATSLTRRAWTAHAGMALAAGVIAFSGMAAVWDSDLYRNARNIEPLILTMEQQERGGDVGYVSGWIAPVAKFYHKGRKDSYCYGGSYGDLSEEEESFRLCARRLFWEQPHAERMWLLVDHSSLQVIETISAGQNGMELVGNREGYSLYVSSDPFRGELDAAARAYQYTTESEPVVQSDFFEVYVRERTLIYIKEPCARSDAAVRFFLHATPWSVKDLPDERKQYGFDNLDFDFPSHGIVADGRCVAVLDLPEYDIKGISTGQLAGEEEQIWRGEFRLGESDTLLSAYQYTTESAPAAQSVFDIYVQEKTLIYLKEPCSPDDAAARFFLHVTPTNVGDLPEDRKQHGFDNLDFDFLWYGAVIDGKCIAVRDLPEYDVERIGTGQFSEEEGRIWQGQVRFHE